MLHLIPIRPTITCLWVQISTLKEYIFESDNRKGAFEILPFLDSFNIPTEWLAENFLGRRKPIEYSAQARRLAAFSYIHRTPPIL